MGVSNQHLPDNSAANGHAAGDDEALRLSALQRYEILDTLPEQGYDDITLLASQICRTPIALISLIDDERQWFKSRVGLDASQTPRDISFCAHAIQTPHQTMIVPDAARDPRFASNPFVTAEPNIRFYAGAPLVTPDGLALGTLCVIDTAPRELAPEQQAALEALSRQVMAQLELRYSLGRMEAQAEERRAVEMALRESEQRFTAFMDNGPAVTFIKDENGCYVYANSLYLRLFNLRREDVIGHYDVELWAPEVYEPVRAHDEAVIAGGRVISIEETVPTPDGRSTHWLTFKFPLEGAGGKRYLGGIAIDITERKYYEQQLQEYHARLEEAVSRLEQAASTDALTGIKNHGALVTRLEEEVARARRYQLPLSLLMLDVDNFKSHNDSFGHPAGDEVLRTVAKILEDHARPSDFVARYGGEEFAVILSNTSEVGAFIVAERIRQAIENSPWPQRVVTISIGVADLSSMATTASALISAADKALYAAKRAGKNQVARAE